MQPEPQTVVKFSSPTDIVGVMPFYVGFTPTESVVVMCLHGPRKRAGRVMRLDLVPAEYERELAELITQHVRRAEADAVIVVIYTDQADGEQGLPQRSFVDAVHDAMPVKSAETLLVRAGRWWSYDCHLPCCPAEGTLIPEVPEGQAGLFAAEAAFEGRAVLPDRSALQASIRPKRGPLSDKALAQALDRARTAAVQEICAGGRDALRDRTLALLRATAERWAEGSRGLSRADAASIVVALHDRWTRDYAATLALDLEPHSYLALLTELCRNADAAAAAPVCTVLGWVALFDGQGALANVAVDRALQSEPDYAMANLLLTGLLDQISPDEIKAMTRGTREDLDAMARGERPRTDLERLHYLKASARRWRRSRRSAVHGGSPRRRSGSRGK